MANYTTVRDERFDHISAGFYREIISGTAQVATASQSGGAGSPVDTLTLEVLRGIFTITDVTISNTPIGTGFFNPGQTGIVYTVAFRVTLPHNLGAQPSIVIGLESASGAITDGSNFLLNSFTPVVDEVTTNSFLVRTQIIILGVAASVANTAMLNLLLPPGDNPARINFVLKLEATQNNQGVQILPQ